MTVHGPADRHKTDDGAGGELGEVKRLPADSASQVEDRWGLWKFTAKTKGPCGASAVTGTLPGQAFVDLEEDLPEAGSGFVHATYAA